MNITGLTKQEFSELFSEEMRKIGANAALIKNNLRAEGKTEVEIADFISAYLRSLGIHIKGDDKHKIEAELGFSKNLLSLDKKVTKKDYMVVSKAFKNYKLYPLDLIIDILKTPKKELEEFQKRISQKI